MSRQANEKFVSHSFASEEHFTTEYKKRYISKEGKKELYLYCVSQLNETIIKNNIDRFRQTSTLISYITNAENHDTLRTYNEDQDNSIRSTNLLLLTCKYNRVEILKFLFDGNKILDNLTVNIGRGAIRGTDIDEESHNAFYYAIRSCDVELLGELMLICTENYFADPSAELDDILSKAYEELKLKKVPLSNKMKVFVESKLIDLRFYSDDYGQDRTRYYDIDSIKVRIEFTLENISLLNEKYSNAEVDGEFLFIVKFIVQNISVLKRQLKSTYDRLPWEEMEFCLICFSSLYTKQQDALNLVFSATLSKRRILIHLLNFSIQLERIKCFVNGANIRDLAILPKVKREEVINKISELSPAFETLYSDYQQVRDVCSLEKINDSITLALSVDPQMKEGQLTIIRFLQVIGEFLKNTLQSPKMSSTISELLVLSLPHNTRETVIALRNSLSHANSLAKRNEIEEITDVNYFEDIQNDIKKIGDVITDIFYKNRIKTIRHLLEKIVHCENPEQIKQFAEVLCATKLEPIISTNLVSSEHEKFVKLIKKFTDSVTNQTVFEKRLFKLINDIINSTKSNFESMRNDYIRGRAYLENVRLKLMKYNIGQNETRGIKFFTKETLKSLTPPVPFQSLRDIGDLISQIFESFSSRQKLDLDDNVVRIIHELFYFVEYSTDDIKEIKKFREKLFNKNSFIPTKKGNLISERGETDANQLLQKISTLTNVLQNNALTDQSIKKYSSYKKNKSLQAAIEMLVLDIISILGHSKDLEDGLFFSDNSSLLLIGKCLRNHLAHDNALINVLSDPTISILVNAKKLAAEGIIMPRKKKIGKIVKDNSSKLRERFYRGLDAITNQERMFAAVEKGNLEDFKDCIKKGGDINARDINAQTIWHFAAKGSSIEMLEFIFKIDLNASVKDVHGESPLHVAAAYGRTNILEFLISIAGCSVNDVNNDGETPLHIAAKNGHVDSVDVLLRLKAKLFAKDKYYNQPPLYSAIKCDQVEAAFVLLGNYSSDKINEAEAGFTPLHLAAERGHLKIVRYLLQNKADINVKSERGCTPLFSAALNGHVETVEALILSGADVQAKVIGGCTPLHYAVQNGHEVIAELLLRNGAKVNAVGVKYKNAPLHYAAMDGHDAILKTLLKFNADPSLTTTDGMSPLHLAAENGHLEIVAALLEHGVDVNVKNLQQCTPLHFAAIIGHKDIAELLIEFKGEVNATTIHNATPLHFAAHKGHRNVAELLIRSKAEVRALDIGGDTPLHYAARNGFVNVIDLFMENEADVDARNFEGMTALHFAASNSHKKAVNCLIKNRAKINVKSNSGFTPLHAVTVEGCTDTVKLLIENKAEVNTQDIGGITPFHTAILYGQKDIAEIFLSNGVDVNSKLFGNQYPLQIAVECNYKELVKVLIANGANVNENNGEPLMSAVRAGYEDITQILLKNRARIFVKENDKISLLHFAAARGHKEVVKILIKEGAVVDAVTINNSTPLLLAAEQGHDDIVEYLLASGADGNARCGEGTSALQIAAGSGHARVVKVLLENKCNVNIKDDKKRTALELAVANGHLQIVKMIMPFDKFGINTKTNDGWTILHIAAHKNNLQMVNYLVDEGADIHAKNDLGSKPIHIAARYGHTNTVEYFLSRGLSIDERNGAELTLLHSAAANRNLKTLECLIARGADVNAQDKDGRSPLHMAAICGYIDIIEALLENGAVYNSVDFHNKIPKEESSNEVCFNLLASTSNLFDAVKRSSFSEVECCIEAGARVNTQHARFCSPLHYAAWKGYDAIVQVLLQNKANPNSVNKKGYTPLHYAAQFSHLKIVKSLLSCGAIYNALSESNKTPADFASNSDVVSFLKLLNDLFHGITTGNVRIIDNLSQIKDIDVMKAVLSACNRENQTLIVAAIHHKFPNVNQLKQMAQGDVTSELDWALMLLDQGHFQEALTILKSTFERNKDVLGSDNPATLDVQYHIAKALYSLGFYNKAFDVFSEIFQKRKKMFGLNNEDVLRTRSMIALVLYRQEKNNEAFDIFEEVYRTQKEVLGFSHTDTLETQLHMALVLERLGKNEEALRFNKSFYDNTKKQLGARHPSLLFAQNNIAMILSKQEKYDEALSIYYKVLEKKREIFGSNHSSTLNTLHSIAGVLFYLEKYHEALNIYEDVLTIQERDLGPNHPDTLMTQYNMGNAMFFNGTFIEALRRFWKINDQMKVVLGPHHPYVLDISEKLLTINERLKMENRDIPDILQCLQKDFSIAANEGDVQVVQRMLKDGIDANDKDTDGRTPLHYAVNNGQVHVVSILLKNGAYVFQVTNKGNTPLHTAVSRNHLNVVEVLLQNVGRDKRDDFVNAKTTAGGTAALHVAAKNGFLEVAKTLLKHGAIYCIENKEGKTPLDVSKDQSIIVLLGLIKELFRDIKKGSDQVIRQLKLVHSSDLPSVTNARCNLGKTLLQQAIAYKHRNIADEIIELLINV